jgi:hypothetical protein
MDWMNVDILDRQIYLVYEYNMNVDGDNGC